jgi:probable addiction module antidote protein
MALKTKRWDPAEMISDEQTARTFLEEVANDGDAREIARITGEVAKALGMMQLARSVNLPVDALFDLINPYDDGFDREALRDIALRLAGQLPAPRSDAAQ